MQNHLAVAIQPALTELCALQELQKNLCYFQKCSLWSPKKLVSGEKSYDDRNNNTSVHPGERFKQH